MKKWLITTVAMLAMLFSTVALARPLTLNEISEAVCRVKMGPFVGKQNAGTGTCIGETPDGQNYYVLTNAHVVGQHSQGTVEFFKGGYKTRPLPATVVWRAYNKGSDVDFAIVMVSKAIFGDYPPRVIPLAPAGYRPTTGNYIATVGCPNARWAQAWEGRITVERQSRVLFVPAPVGGQSGSGITVLIQDKDGIWHTRVGAVLTWRLGDNMGNFHGGAIPVSTLYNVLAGTHVAYQVPVHYTEVSTVDTGKWAMGSNQRLYRVYSVNGNNTVNFGQGPHVRILTWDYYKTGCCPPSFGSGSGSCPPSFGSGPSPWRGPSPQPQPRPSPGVPPYSQQPPNGGGNPYGVKPPSIGAPWPGITPEAPKAEAEEEKPPLPPLSDELQDLGDKYNVLSADKKKLEDQIAELEDQILVQADADIAKAKAEADAKAEAEQQAVEQESETAITDVGLWQRFKTNVNGFFGGILMGAGIGLLIFVWNKFLKKRVIQRVDSLQDYLENKIKGKWGPELAGEARDVMEGVEDALLGFADDFLEDIQARKQVAKSVAKGQPAARVVNGSRRSNVSEILEAVREASREVGDENVTTEVPRRVDEILAQVAKDKLKN